jgi:hypothetical protein
MKYHFKELKEEYPLYTYYFHHQTEWLPFKKKDKGLVKEIKQIHKQY